MHLNTLNIIVTTNFSFPDMSVVSAFMDLPWYKKILPVKR